MIKRPPAKSELPVRPFEEISEKYPTQMTDYLSYYKPCDSKGRYLPFDEFRHRVASKIDEKLAWAITKLSRTSQYHKLLAVGEPSNECHFILTPLIQKTISQTDRHATTAVLEWMSSKIGEERHFEYLLNDLIDDEAISSSQLEGAATTTLVAKDMLKRKRKPRTPDEKMILGNFQMMLFAWENRNKPLSIELIRELHKVGVEGIDDDKYTPGIFRKTDDVVIVDGEGDTIHTPPPCNGIKERLKKIVAWINLPHDDSDSRHYIHPLIKAITFHFSIGYEHPFRDGNGRVARSLFYWFMFKHDYAAFRYIAISLLLKKAPIKYGKSYLYSETDELDLTYFIEHQCDIILRAITSFKQAYSKSLQDIEEFNTWLWTSGLYKSLNEKQKIVFQVAKNGGQSLFTASNVKENLDCSYNTASSTLNGLVELNLFKKEKIGREWFFTMLDRKEIKNKWSKS